MPRYHTLGNIPKKRHTIFKSKNGNYYYEQLFGTEGFNNHSSLMYHINRPTQVKEILNSYSVEPKIAIDKNPNAYFHMELNENIIEYTFKTYPHFFTTINIRSDLECNIALKVDGLNIKHISTPTDDMCKIAINQNINAFDLIKNYEKVFMS